MVERFVARVGLCLRTALFCALYDYLLLDLRPCVTDTRVITTLNGEYDFPALLARCYLFPVFLALLIHNVLTIPTSQAAQDDIRLSSINTWGPSDLYPPQSCRTAQPTGFASLTPNGIAPSAPATHPQTS